MQAHGRGPGLRRRDCGRVPARIVRHDLVSQLFQYRRARRGLGRRGQERHRHRGRGQRLGRGESLVSVIKAMRTVAEGVKTSAAVYRLAQSLGVDMPITAAMNAVLDGSLSPVEAVRGLMSRALKEEG